MSMHERLNAFLHLDLPAIQLAKFSGFSPVIATASPQHEKMLRALGATHVVPHSTPPTKLQELTSSIPLTVYFLTRTTPETIPPAVDALSPSGLLITTSSSTLESVTKPLAEKANKGIKAVAMHASPYIDTSVDFGKGIYAALEGMLECGEIRGNEFEILKGGLDAVKGGLERVKKGTGGVKLVVHPEETSVVGDKFGS